MPFRLRSRKDAALVALSALLLAAVLIGWDLLDGLFWRQRIAPARRYFYAARGMVLTAALVAVWLKTSARERRELRERESQWELFIERTQDGVIVASRGQRILYSNPAARRIFARDIPVGTHVSALIPPHYRDFHNAAVVRYLATGQGRIMGRPVILEALGADGSEFPVEVTLSVTGAGSELRFYALVRDLRGLEMKAPAL